MRRKSAYLLFLTSLTLSIAAHAGPPYVTDDPEPVEFKHFEFYLASITNRNADGWSGSGPLLDANFGALPDLHLHMLLPAAFSAPTSGPSHYGLCDIELGAKFRFIHETKSIPQIAIYPLVELPTGDENKNLGNGHVQVFIPIWIQKSFGAWTAFGGFGYWVNTGAGRENSWYLGGVIQRRLSSKVSLGTEFFHATSQFDLEDETRFNLGFVFDISRLHHVLISAGRGIQGPNRFQSYVGYQLTFGWPENSSKNTND